MEFSVDPAIFARYPTLLVGVIACHGIRNGSAPAEVTAQLRQAEKQLRENIADTDQLKAHPNIAAWQEVHRGFGSNPNKFQPSVQALAKRVLNGKELPSISALVDLYNITSLTALLPVGGEDIDVCQGNIVLTFAKGGEQFRALGEEQDDPPEVGEVLYRDDFGVICRRFNWREAARTCLTEKTTNAVLVIEAVLPTMRDVLSEELVKLSSSVAQHCGGTLKTYILDPEHPACTL